MLRNVIVVLTLCLGSTLGASYHGYQVLRTDSLRPSAVDALRQIDGHFDFWKDPRMGRSADIMAAPEDLEHLKNYLRKKDIGFSVMVEDVESLISSSKKIGSRSKTGGPMTWDDYYSHDDLNAYLDDLAAKNDNVSVVSIGKSYEGRDMKVIRIMQAGEGAPNVFIEAGIHAREWIAPAMSTYILHMLLETEGTNPDYLQNLNFHILPSANPDGYQYSRTDDRLWRKTRSPTGSIWGCKGVDPNRNWDFHWHDSGVSDLKCQEIYPGDEAFSEIETRNIRDYVLGLEPVPVLAHCLHSYSQLWLYPYGYAYNAYPENVDEIRALGEEAVKALEAVHGTVFDPINSADLYPAAGASDDWYKGVLGARFAYTTELRDTGSHGFVLPPDQIIPSGEELWAAMEVVLEKMIQVSV